MDTESKIAAIRERHAKALLISSKNIYDYYVADIAFLLSHCAGLLEMFLVPQARRLPCGEREGDAMTKLTEPQLAEIAARHEQECQWSREKHDEVSPGEPYSESGWCPVDMSLADVSALLNHIAAVTAELAAANARADGERAAVVAYLRGQADMTVRQANENKISNAAISTAVRSFRLVADAIERGEHEKGGGDGRR